MNEKFSLNGSGNAIMNHTKQKLQGGNFALWLVTDYKPINFALTVRVRGAFTPDQFQQALDKVRLKYPSSAMRVTKESDGNAYLISDVNLKFPVRIIERKHSESWVEEASTELGQIFDLLNQPPLRLVWLRSDNVSEIVFVCSHALADGLSAAYLARDLLIFMSDPQADVEPIPLNPAMSELIPDFPGRRIGIWRTKLRAALLKLLISLRPKTDQQSEAGVDTAKPKYNLLPWELTPQQTSTLVTRSRAEGTTVHAALGAAFLRAFGEFHGDSWKRKIQSPVNLRERLTHPVGEAFGLFINLVEFYANCAPERDFWEVAREIKEGFIRYAGDKPIFSSVMDTTVLMDELTPILTPQNLAEFWPGVEYDLSITNLGRLDFPLQYGSLQLEALYGPSISGIPEEIVLGVATIGGIMRFTLVFTSLKLSISQAEQIKEKAMHWLAVATDW
jgi:hypothetical protein